MGWGIWCTGLFFHAPCRPRFRFTLFERVFLSRRIPTDLGASYQGHFSMYVGGKTAWAQMSSPYITEVYIATHTLTCGMRFLPTIAMISSPVLSLGRATGNWSFSPFSWNQKLGLQVPEEVLGGVSQFLSPIPFSCQKVIFVAIVIQQVSELKMLKNCVLIFLNCLLCTNICTHKYCKFILNNCDMFRC